MSDKLLKDFEVATAEVAQLESQLERAKQRRDDLRRRLRTALSNGGDRASEAPSARQSAPAPTIVPESIRSVVEVLERVKKPCNAQDLAGELKTSDANARNRLVRAFALGLVRRVRRGYYVANDGKAAR